jgi:hypothetical protein
MDASLPTQTKIVGADVDAASMMNASDEDRWARVGGPSMDSNEGPPDPDPDPLDASEILKILRLVGSGRGCSDSVARPSSSNSAKNLPAPLPPSSNKEQSQ